MPFYVHSVLLSLPPLTALFGLPLLPACLIQYHGKGKQMCRSISACPLLLSVYIFHLFCRWGVGFFSSMFAEYLVEQSLGLQYGKPFKLYECVLFVFSLCRYRVVQASPLTSWHCLALLSTLLTIISLKDTQSLNDTRYFCQIIKKLFPTTMITDSRSIFPLWVRRKLARILKGYFLFLPHKTPKP